MRKTCDFKKICFKKKKTVRLTSFSHNSLWLIFFFENSKIIIIYSPSFEHDSTSYVICRVSTSLGT